MKKMSDAYSGREQALVKHTILESYLQRLFMIVGRSKCSVINYVDCFSGPWQATDEKLADTSIGISLTQIAACRESLRTTFGREVRFRALYIERDPTAFKKLQNFLSTHPYGDIETKTYLGDYTTLTKEILQWCGPHFTFFFVDPMGFKNVVGARTMQHLLQRQESEFLINLMYDFVNRFISLEKHAPDWEELMGEVPDLNGLSPDQRQEKILGTYRGNLKQFYRGRTAYVSIQKPGSDRPLYYLVYLTRNAVGIDVFKQEAEKMEIVQRVMQQEYKLRQKAERTQTFDMFADAPSESTLIRITDNKLSAKKYLMEKLSATPLEITVDVWAGMLEETNFFPSDLQTAMKELIDERKVENLDADVSRRSAQIVKRLYAGKSERWRLSGNQD